MNLQADPVIGIYLNQHVQYLPDDTCTGFQLVSHM